MNDQELRQMEEELDEMLKDASANLKGEKWNHIRRIILTEQKACAYADEQSAMVIDEMKELVDFTFVNTIAIINSFIDNLESSSEETEEYVWEAIRSLQHSLDVYNDALYSIYTSKVEYREETCTYLDSYIDVIHNELKKLG